MTSGKYGNKANAIVSTEKHRKIIRTNNKVTKEIKETIKLMKKKGFSNKSIGKTLNLAESTIQYHSDKTQRKNQIKRAMKNEKPRDRKEYMKEYQSTRYNNDPEFKEKLKELNRKNWRKKNGTK